MYRPVQVRRFRILPSWWLGLAIVLLSGIAPLGAGAQVLEPPCENALPGGPGTEEVSSSTTAIPDPCPPPDTGVAPPTLTLTPSSSSTALAVLVQLEYCGELPYGHHQVFQNGRDISSLFAFSSQTPTWDCSNKATASATVTLDRGSNYVQATASDGWKTGTDDATYVTPARPLVFPRNREEMVAANRSLTRTFRVVNDSSGTATINFSTQCTGTVAGCTAGIASASVKPNLWVDVPVTFTTGAHGSQAVVKLSAVFASSAVADTGRYTLAARGDSLIVDLLSAGSPYLDRAGCLTIAAGDAAAYECGHLRLAHALPSTRTLGKDRTPTLIYNSATATPRPYVAANVTLVATSVPDSVTAEIIINSAVRAHARWSGSDWTTNGTRRIVLPILNWSEATGVYPYTLELTYWGAGAFSRTSITGTLAAVNRSQSAYGAGWWLAGLEWLDVTTKQWVGGDGSTHVYQAVPGRANLWYAPDSDLADTLRYDGSGSYERYLPGGLRIKFNAAGRHERTMNRLGYATSFIYANGLLTQINLPPWNERHYSFAYSGGKLATITAPGPTSSTTRITTATIANGQLTQIQDPDLLGVGFAYQPGNNFVASRSNRRNQPTSYAIDSVGRLTQSSIVPLPGKPAVVTGFVAGEYRGLPAALGGSGARDTAELYTELLGPRTDVADNSRYYLTRLGEVAKVVNAEGFATRARRDDPRWPRAVTSSVAPNGRTIAATFDQLGFMVESTDSSTSDDGGPGGATRYATSRYEWDPRWHEVTKIVRPMSDSVIFEYNTTNGNRTLQRDGRGVNVYFGHDQATLQLRAVGMANGVTIDSLWYDRQGNLSMRRGAGPIRTYFYNDSVGRPIRMDESVGQANLGGTGTRSTHYHYEWSGMDTLVVKNGPQISYTGMGLSKTWSPAELRVRKISDADGNLLRVEQSGTTGYQQSQGNPPFTVKPTRYEYDALGRRVKQIAPDSLIDHYELDGAGNVKQWITRRGDTLRMEYDVVNRLTKRVVPGKSYAREGSSQQYPRLTSGPLIFAADSALFSYDSMGNMTSAVNGDARIARSYYPNGLLRTDEERVRTYAGNDFSKHIYELRYSYDLNGRRTGMRHPAGLVIGRTGTMVTDSTKYTYHPQLGLLQTVTNPQLDEFRITYDAQARLDTIVFPNGVREWRGYDSEGRFAIMKQTAPSTQYWTDARIDSTILAYTNDHKVASANFKAGLELTETIYNGLGAVGFQQHAYWSSDYGQYRVTKQEVFNYTPLGHNFQTEVITLGQARTDWTNHYLDAAGRHVSDSSWIGDAVLEWRGSPYAYDAAGNLHFTGRNRVRVRCNGGAESDESLISCRSYGKYHYAEQVLHWYDAENRLRRSEKENNDPDYHVGNLTGIEEYRYDALGRRVLKRWNSDCIRSDLCNDQNYGYRGHVERFVYDGDQILYEIRSPGNRYTPSDSMELDVYEAQYPGTRDLQRYGRVSYTHGLGIDQALSAVRSQTYALWSVTVFLHPNWQGQYVNGTNLDGLPKWCAPGSTTNCTHINFAVHRTRTKYDKSSNYGPDDDRFTWVGSFLATKFDNSGLIYMRNRYYDPGSGRFTQEDPIGLAGGLNVYGFAQGDPVNFSDPFGLCPIEKPLCHWIKAALIAAGTDLGAMLGGGAGLLTGPGAVVASPAGAIGGAALGAGAGLAAGELVESKFFSNQGEGAGSGGTKPSSAGRMQKEVERGQSPRSVDRVDKGRTYKEQDNVHFRSGDALNRDGSWKHGGRELTNAEKDWITGHGWSLPK